MMKRSATLMVVVLIGLGAIARAEGSLFPVKVSPTGRYFVDQKGQPVFWLGTTQWQLCRDYTLDEVRLITGETGRDDRGRLRARLGIRLQGDTALDPK